MVDLPGLRLGGGPVDVDVVGKVPLLDVALEASCKRWDGDGTDSGQVVMVIVDGLTASWLWEALER